MLAMAPVAMAVVVVVAAQDRGHRFDITAFVDDILHGFKHGLMSGRGLGFWYGLGFQGAACAAVYVMQHVLTQHGYTQHGLFENELSFNATARPMRSGADAWHYTTRLRSRSSEGAQLSFSQLARRLRGGGDSEAPPEPRRLSELWVHLLPRHLARHAFWRSVELYLEFAIEPAVQMHRPPAPPACSPGSQRMERLQDTELPLLERGEPPFRSIGLHEHRFHGVAPFEILSEGNCLSVGLPCPPTRPSSPTEAMGGVQGLLALHAGQLFAVALKAKEEMEEARKRLPYTYGYPSRPSWAGGEPLNEAQSAEREAYTRARDDYLCSWHVHSRRSQRAARALLEAERLTGENAQHLEHDAWLAERLALHSLGLNSSSGEAGVGFLSLAGQHAFMTTLEIMRAELNAVDIERVKQGRPYGGPSGLLGWEIWHPTELFREPEGRPDHGHPFYRATTLRYPLLDDWRLLVNVAVRPPNMVFRSVNLYLVKEGILAQKRFFDLAIKVAYKSGAVLVSNVHVADHIVLSNASKPLEAIEQLQGIARSSWPPLQSDQWFLTCLKTRRLSSLNSLRHREDRGYELPRPRESPPYEAPIAAFPSPPSSPPPCRPSEMPPGRPPSPPRLARPCVTWCIEGVRVMSPSTEQLAELAPDDTVLVPPHRPKTSQLHPPASPSSAYATALHAVREGATGGELHAPLRQLSLSLDVEPKGPTYKAIEAVLSKHIGLHCSDQKAWEATGAKQSNYYFWRKRIAKALLGEASPAHNSLAPALGYLAALASLVKPLCTAGPIARQDRAAAGAPLDVPAPQATAMRLRGFGDTGADPSCVIDLALLDFEEQATLVYALTTYENAHGGRVLTPPNYHNRKKGKKNAFYARGHEGDAAHQYGGEHPEGRGTLGKTALFIRLYMVGSGEYAEARAAHPPKGTEELKAAIMRAQAAAGRAMEALPLISMSEDDALWELTPRFRDALMAAQERALAEPLPWMPLPPAEAAIDLDDPLIGPAADAPLLQEVIEHVVYKATAIATLRRHFGRRARRRRFYLDASRPLLLPASMHVFQADDAEKLFDSLDSLQRQASASLLQAHRSFVKAEDWSMGRMTTRSRRTQAIAAANRACRDADDVATLFSELRRAARDTDLHLVEEAVQFSSRPYLCEHITPQAISPLPPSPACGSGSTTFALAPDTPDYVVSILRGMPESHKLAEGCVETREMYVLARAFGGCQGGDMAQRDFDSSEGCPSETLRFIKTSIKSIVLALSADRSKTMRITWGTTPARLGEQVFRLGREASQQKRNDSETATLPPPPSPPAAGQAVLRLRGFGASRLQEGTIAVSISMADALVDHMLESFESSSSKAHAVYALIPLRAVSLAFQQVIDSSNLILAYRGRLGFYLNCRRATVPTLRLTPTYSSLQGTHPFRQRGALNHVEVGRQPRDAALREREVLAACSLQAVFRGRQMLRLKAFERYMGLRAEDCPVRQVVRMEAFNCLSLRTANKGPRRGTDVFVAYMELVAAEARKLLEVRTEAAFVIQEEYKLHRLKRRLQVVAAETWEEKCASMREMVALSVLRQSSGWWTELRPDRSPPLSPLPSPPDSDEDEVLLIPPHDSGATFGAGSFSPGSQGGRARIATSPTRSLPYVTASSDGVLREVAPASPREHAPELMLVGPLARETPTGLLWVEPAVALGERARERDYAHGLGEAGRTRSCSSRPVGHPLRLSGATAAVTGHPECPWTTFQKPGGPSTEGQATANAGVLPKPCGPSGERLMPAPKAGWFRARFLPLLKSRELALRAQPACHPSVMHAADLPPPHLPSWERSDAAMAEYGQFEWPLTSVDDVRRLLRCAHIAPTWLLLGEFSRAQATQLETRRGVAVLTVDRRPPLGPGLAYQGEFQDVLHLSLWEGVFTWASCTHQAVADELCCDDKALDGRMFWGMANHIYCHIAPQALAVVSEQPRTWLPLFFDAPYFRVEPAFYGDAMTKTINLYVRGAKLPPLVTLEPGDWTRKRLREFDDGDAADRWRSSWAHYPQMTAALATGTVVTGADGIPVYAEEIQRFAESWHRSGLPVPWDYLNSDGRPTHQEDRDYLLVRGKGDGRRVSAVDPTPSDVAPRQPHAAEPAAQTDELSERHLTLLSTLGQAGVLLVIVSTLGQPLAFAALDGLQVLGAELPLAQLHPGSPLRFAQSWAAAIGGSIAAATTFLVGRYKDGPRVAVVPLEYCPPTQMIVRSVEQRRRRCQRGTVMGWCTLAALSGAAISDPVARALAHVISFIRPVQALADSDALGFGSSLPTFSFGAMAAASMVRVPVLVAGLSPPGWLVLRREVHEAKLITAALLRSDGVEARYLHEWAELIRPPALEDVPAELLAALPSFEAEALMELAFTPEYRPPLTRWLPRRPPQPTRVERCPMSVRDLLLPFCTRRVERWLSASLDHLRCTEKGLDECQPLRPHPLVVGQGCLHAWARGIIWDFTFERSTCGVPLDMAVPIESHLDLEYLASALRDYPDQRLVSYLVDGVRFEADVELHAVLIPHLLSLAKGFESVRKELLRMESLGWYKFFAGIPFWPIYLNGQGSTPRKLEPDRWRRTTEGGGPRKEVFDEEGLRAWSLNDAAAAYHTPRYYQEDASLLAWAQQVLSERGLDAGGILPRKWPKELKPTPSDVMRDLSILKAAAHALQEPVYLFGDDAKDYFSQLAMAPEAWWQLGVVFLSAEQLAERHSSNSFRPVAGELYFVSERRLGFGVMPSSNIAQRFSEALLSLFRERMDAEEAAIASRETRPSFLEWRRRRTRVPQEPGVPGNVHALRQQRLYFCHYYTDDPIIGVVGVRRALAAIRVWRRVTTDVRLIMAIPEKRNLGTWALWLGILFFAGMGLVVIPKNKLLRAAAAVTKALSGTMEFGSYRSLMGLLEHLRCVNRARRSAMFGLYEPHKPSGASQHGPNGLVVPSPLMLQQLQKWLKMIAQTGGTSVLSALDKAWLPRPTGVVFTASADAATDSVVPGMGGYCHGLYWYLPIRPAWLEWMHITVLELLATGLNAIVFASHFRGAQRVVLLSDALATPYALTQHSQHSTALMITHQALLADALFAETAELAECAHLSGDCNAFSDAVSRGEWPRFMDLCRSVGVTAMQLPVPPRVIALVSSVESALEERGVRINASSGRREHAVPDAMLGLDGVLAQDGSARAMRLRGRGLREFAALLRGETGPETGQGDAGSSVQHHGRSPVATPQERRAIANPQLPEFAQRLRSRSDSSPSPSKLAKVEVGGLRLPDRPRGSSLASEINLRDSPLRVAAREHAQRRAVALADSPFAPSMRVDRLVALLQHADEVAEYGSAHGTLRKDEITYRHWTFFAQEMGFDPLLTQAQVRDFPEHVSTLMATFLLHVYPKMKGANGREWAKPRSAFAYVLALIRIFRRWKVILPAAKCVKAELAGLLRAFVVTYGKAALQPRRREPLLFSMLEKLNSIADGQRLCGYRFTLSEPACRAFKRMLNVGWRTGHRLAEFVQHPSGEVYHLTRADLTWIIGNVKVSDPSPEQLRRLVPGDVALLAPPRSKTDQFGEIHSPFPSVILYDPQRSCNAGVDLRNIEEEQPCRGDDRSATALFADDAGHALTHARMDDLLDKALRALFGNEKAGTYSWHSLRSGLACALKAANCPPAEIQLICRWLNPESLRAYARLGTSQFVTWVDAAERVAVDAVQTSNMPKSDLCEGFAGLNIEFGGKRLSAAAQAAADAADERDSVPPNEPDERGSVPPRAPVMAPVLAPDLSALHLDNCLQRLVLVPSSCWPSYACNENDGRGWAGRILDVERRSCSVLVQFLDACDERGRPYASARLALAAVTPL